MVNTRSFRLDSKKLRQFQVGQINTLNTKRAASVRQLGYLIIRIGLG